MSTKIYNGYKIDFNDFYELRLFCEELGQKIIEKRQELVGKRSCEIITNNIINLIMGYKPEIEKYTFWDAYKSLSDKQDQIKNTKQRDPLNDFEFAVTFIPLEDKTLCLLYTERKDFKEIWESYSIVKDYYYQNQTDMPEDISQEEWEQREIDWENALKYDIPCLSGFTFEPVYISVINIITKNGINPYFYDLDKIVDLYSQRILEKIIVKDNQFYEIKNWQKIMERIKELKKNNKYQRKLKISKKKLKKRLDGWKDVRLKTYYEIMETLMWSK